MYFLILYERRQQRRQGWESGKHFSELQLHLSSTLIFQFAAITVPEHLLCTLGQIDGYSEDLKVGHYQGEHHFCGAEPSLGTGEQAGRLGPGAGEGLELHQVLLSPSRGELLPLFHKTQLIPGHASPASHQTGKKQTKALPISLLPLSHFIPRKSSTTLFSAQLQYNPSSLGHNQLKHWIKEGTWWQQTPSNITQHFGTLMKASHVNSYVQKATPALSVFIWLRYIFCFPKRIKATKREQKGRSGRTAAAWERWETRGSCLWCLDDHILAITMSRALLCHW